MLTAQMNPPIILDRESDALRETNSAYLLAKARQDSIRYYAERERAIGVARAAGMPIEGTTRDGGSFSLQGFDDSGQLAYYQTDNLVAAQFIGTEELWAGGDAGLNLNGMSQFAMMIWDGGRVLSTHQELTGRVSQADGASTLSDHATHVAGTMCATGVNPNAKGMAYKSQLRAFDFNNDISEMTTQAANNWRLSNHSYGKISGWNINETMNNRLEWWGNTSISGTEDYKFGFYNEDAQSFDNIIFNAPFYVAVRSAGNDRNDTGSGSHWAQSPPTSGTWVQSTVTRQQDGGSDRYESTPPGATAKNIITVGALEVEDLGGLLSPSMSTFSSWGPTDDGRIKPDVMAKGTPTFSSIATNNTAYGIKSGTSMAAPSVTGSIQLLQEHWSNLAPGTALRASAIKALVIHTADDWTAGSADEGPDYESGWGVMDTRKAADFLTNAWEAPAAERTNWFRSKDSLNSGDTRTLTFYHSEDSEDFKVTIAWTDPAATPSAPALNPTTLRLINDLDLRVTSAAGTTYFPWRLNPNSPDAAATKGDNFRDNVEQVLEGNLPAGLYTVQITHKGGNLAGGKQIFSIMVSGIAVPVTCFGNTELTSCSGTVSDGSGASNYSNNLDCSWTIRPPGAASVTLTFTEFDTDDFESVEIYDGTDDSAPSLGKY